MPHLGNTHGSDRVSTPPTQDTKLTSHSNGWFDWTHRARWSELPPNLTPTRSRMIVQDLQIAQDHWNHVDPQHRVGPRDVSSPDHRSFGHHQQSPTAYRGYVGSPRSKDSHDSRLNPHGRIVPSGAVECDRPIWMSEKQREAIKACRG
ncbi:hypothetical protein BGZ97_001166 [Linnemannia gamsii]|jgi:hypothetical protein|uniref:Uncharacterized protein n=1 Tax=Linnemannia gamsii TaxID=64522 RepID=A0A9P6QYB0_9FUNG|nr:hypothetical protein BGZ97_001166 [Linnemannia gamsii]